VGPRNSVLTGGSDGAHVAGVGRCGRRWWGMGFEEEDLGAFIREKTSYRVGLLKLGFSS
jgi:hypothetical protein